MSIYLSTFVGKAGLTNFLMKHLEQNWEDWDLTHALNCKKGGLVIACHNEARDLNWDLCTLAGRHQIISELVLQEPSDDQLGLRAEGKVQEF